MPTPVSGFCYTGKENIMRETLKDWKEEWISTNGITTGLEVVIKDSKLHDMAPYIYEGSFVEIPEELLDRKVVETSKIIDSSIPKRIGAYSLTV